MTNERAPNAPIAVITGSSDGIGLATATQLAMRGWHVVIVGRDAERTAAAVAAVQRQAGPASAAAEVADLLLQSEVRALAARLQARLPHIDALINNAGATFSTFARTADGVERTIALNHLAYFLLTGLLLPQLRKARGGRVINVASASHRDVKGLDIESFTRDKGHFILQAYGWSKLANVMFTVSLAERLRSSSVTAHCLHPGTIATQIGNKATMSRLHAWAWSVNAWLRATSIDNGAKTSVFLATADEPLQRPGQYWASFSRVWNIPYPHPRIEPTHPLVADPTARHELWTTSEQLCQFHFPLEESAGEPLAEGRDSALPSRSGAA